MRKDTEKALMAYRQSLQDGLPIEQVQQRLDVAKAKLTESAGLLGSDGLSWSLSYVNRITSNSSRYTEKKASIAKPKRPPHPTRLLLM